MLSHSHRSVSACALSLCASVVVVAVLALLPCSALANSVHVFTHAIGTGVRGEGAGELELASPIWFGQVEFKGEAPPEFEVAGSGVAVNDETHDVYISDTGNHRVDEFTETGLFIRAFGKEVGGLGEDTCTLMCKAGAVGSAPGALAAPSFVAVDNAPGESYGDVYVGDGVGKEAENEQQFLELPSIAGGGTYTLSFEGHETKPIAHVAFHIGPRKEEDDGEAAIVAQEALEKLPGLSGNVSVREFPSENGLRIEFIDALAETAVPALNCDGSDLTPAGSNCNVGIGTPGSHFVGETISKFTSVGVLVKSWSVEGQLDGSTASDGPFRGQLNGIAVDTAGDLWVSDDKEVYEFEQGGAFKENFHTEHNSAGGIAVGAPGEIHYAILDNPGVSGIALDTADKVLYEDHGSSIEAPHEVLTSSGLEEGGGVGLAVDSSVETAASSGAVYAANTTTDQVEAFDVVLETLTLAVSSGVTATSATLNGTVNPYGSQVSECYFEYGTSTEYEHSAPCEQTPEEIGEAKSLVPVSVKLKDLLGGTTYHYRLVAVKGTSRVAGDDEVFSTLTVPVVTDAESVGVSGSGAELRAQVDPEGLQVGHCRFEYGTSNEYGQAAQCEPGAATIGAGNQPVAVSTRLGGLFANTTYHWRVVVTDANGEGTSPDSTFVYSTNGASLPDHRAYEMVTPPKKNGASIATGAIGLSYGVAEDGSRVIAISTQCFADSLSCVIANDGQQGEPFEFTRTSGGWVATALPPSANEFSEDSPWLLSPEEGMALFSATTAVTSEEDWYARQPGSTGSFVDVGPTTPPAGGRTNWNDGYADPSATADLSHVVWQTLGGLWPFTGTDEQLVEYAGTDNAQPFLVGIDSEGSPMGGCATEFGSEAGGRWDALSADGQIVYFTACGTGLYARVDGGEAGAHTVAVSSPECEDVKCHESESHPAAAVFDGASEDGSMAFFIDSQQLADEATQGSNNLYERDLDLPEGHNLIDVSAGDTSGLGPQVQGVVAISADGSHVYFVANGVLTKAANSEGDTAQAGTCRKGGSGGAEGRCNLYVYERDDRYPDGHVAYIETVPATDYENWQGGEYRYANVTPEGRYLVFESHGDLTPDDTRTDGSTQVFRYDAESEQLVRISIGEGGFDDNGNAGTGQATIVPPYPDFSFEQAGPARGDPTMSNDGSHVFFQSPIGLTPQALNDVVVREDNGLPGYAQNIYEWEPDGTGVCVETQGCVYLVSDGRDTSPSSKGSACSSGRATGPEELVFSSAVCLLGSSTNGDNVFFTTADKLVAADTDTQVDIYDARVCEPENGNPCITEPPPALPPCLGEACHGIPAGTPSLPAPGSASFNGQGNIVSSPSIASTVKKSTKRTIKCKRGFVKKKDRCVRERTKGKRSKGKVTRAKRANNDRRAGR